jgi:hypothetical protein
MVKWEYKEEVISDPREGSEVIDFLNKCGQKGWELFEQSYFRGNEQRLPKLTLLFKRPTETP